jgi:8-oxo-dGTP pyrophosphatase MutT (NUDIX family)
MEETEVRTRKSYSRIAYLADYLLAINSGLGIFSLTKDPIPCYFDPPSIEDLGQYSYLLSSGLYICLELNESGFYVIPGGQSLEGEDVFETVLRELTEENPLTKFWDIQIMLNSVGLVSQEWVGRNGEICTDTMVIVPFTDFDNLDPNSQEIINNTWVRFVDCVEIYKRGGMPENIFRLISAAFKGYYDSWNYLSPRMDSSIKETGNVWFDQLPLEF